MSRARSLAAGIAVAGTLAAAGLGLAPPEATPGSSYRAPGVISQVDVIRRVYPDLYARATRKTVAERRSVSWNRLRRMARTRWTRQHPAAVRAAEIRYLDANPTPEGNRRLARLMFPETFWAFDRIIAGGDGIGGAPGESDWRHNVWNGGQLGGDSPGPSALSCGGGAYAYGLGQACPRSKMAEWSGNEAIYDSPKRQLLWMVHYATGRYGSMAAAANYWSIQRSW